jgi:antitoxin MazE
MIKRLSRHGNSLALVIDRPILDLLGIDERTSLDISTDGQALVIVPVRDEKRRKRFEEALASTNRRYGKALKSLAGTGQESSARPAQAAKRARVKPSNKKRSAE